MCPYESRASTGDPIPSDSTNTLPLNAQTPKHHIYPEALLGLDPLFLLNVRLFIADILALRRYPQLPDILFYGNHPIRNVEIMGVIRAVDRSSSRVIYTIDDSSGTIPCAYWQNTSASLKLGTMVSVVGRPGQWQDQPQITIYEISPITDPNTEIMRWLEIISLKKDVYNRPFFLSPAIYKKAIAALEADSDNNDTKDDFDFDTLKPSEVNEFAFQKAIIKHLKENDVTDFPYSIIRSSPEMNRCAGKVLLYQYETATPDPQRVSGLFERTIHKLVKEGFLIVKDKDSDVYEVVDNKRNIGPAVLEVIREAEKGFDCEAGGVFQSYIIMKVKEIPRFSSLPRHVVQQALDWLENICDIYQVGEKGSEYRSL